MRYRKKPIVIEAVQWNGKTTDELLALNLAVPWHVNVDHTMTIMTLEGNMVAQIGDWVIKGVNGEGYPCKADIFAKSYEPAE